MVKYRRKFKFINNSTTTTVLYTSYLNHLILDNRLYANCASKTWLGFIWHLFNNRDMITVCDK